MEQVDTVIDPKLDFPVVGIGASAGGLEAVTAMFQKVDPGLGLAYVLVMHLDPNHESLMVELLSRKTRVEVRQIKDGDALRPDCLHVIPPGFTLDIEEGKFRLGRFEEPRGLRRPIDGFFASLARAQGERCACVVLSGTGADGTAGLEISKDFGGVVAVQSPEEARYDGMPFSAISTNLIDFTLPAEEIIPRLRSYFDGNRDPDLEGIAGADTAIERIFEAVHRSSGNNFEGYKPSMLMRRLKRRMQVKDYTDLNVYAEVLVGDREEQAALSHDFLINVTSFFRDLERFETLRKTVIAPMVSRAGQSDEIRIWVPGCSSGQEAYTMAMLFDRCCDEAGKRPYIQIFATDIDAEMIGRARRAEYLVTELADIPEYYRNKYTVGGDGKFDIVSKIKDMVRVSYHNVTQDPPFSRIDLISCRNLLIYLGEDLQREIFPVMHFSLKPGGHLFLGPSESITRQMELFATVDSDARIFRSLPTHKRVHLNMPLGRSSSRISGRGTPSRLPEEQDYPKQTYTDSPHDEVFQEYAPPFVRVSKDNRIVSSSGDLAPFLLSRPGEERDVFALLRESLRDVGLSLVSSVQKEGGRQAVRNVEVGTSLGTFTTDIVAHPLRDQSVALVFIVQEGLKPILDKYTAPPISVDKRIADLHSELASTQLRLKSTREEVDTVNEELKSSNEEMMSMNEELQSANEELTTANEELKNKIDELSLSNADLDNFINLADMVMVVLDRSLRIRHVTKAAQSILPLKQADKGRFLTEFNLPFGAPDLTQSLLNVIANKQVFSQTVQTVDGDRSFLMRVTPYFYHDGSVEGATLTLTDISDEADLRHTLTLESERLKLALRAGRMGFADLDVASQTVAVDEALAAQFNLPKAGQITMDELKGAIDAEDHGQVETALEQAVARGIEYEIQFRVRDPKNAVRWIRTSGIPYETREGRKKVIGPTIDVTESVLGMERRELLISEMSHRIKNLFAVISSLVRFSGKAEQSNREMSTALIERIASLGRVYDLARKRASFDEVEIEDLINSVLAPHKASQGILLGGPHIKVAGHTLNTLTMILHELTTNAYKYGALSSPDGVLEIRWSKVDDGKTRFIWKEAVPQFTRQDNPAGFGSRLLTGAAEQLEGSLERRFTENGAEVEFTANLALGKGI